MVGAARNVALYSPGFVARVSAWFARFRQQPKPIELIDQRYNFLPMRFRWSGHVWRVRKVQRIWDEAATPARAPRRYFHVVCDDGGERMLFQDLRLGMWYLSA